MLALRRRFSDAQVKVDADDPRGVTYVDVEIDSRSFSITVQGTEKLGLVDRDRPGFGDSADWVFDSPEELAGFLEAGEPALRR